jgi:hypothetical protein
MGSGPQWEQYKRMKNMGDFASESVVSRDDKLNPGGGGCIWEPGQPESSAVCTPINGGHDMISSATNSRGQFDFKGPKQAAAPAAAGAPVTAGKASKRFIG